MRREGEVGKYISMDFDPQKNEKRNKMKGKELLKAEGTLHIISPGFRKEVPSNAILGCGQI